MLKREHSILLQGEHSAILLTFIKIPFVFKTFILSIFEWPLKTGEERAGCFALFVFLVSRECCVALPHDATGLSAVCDCGIS